MTACPFSIVAECQVPSTLCSIGRSHSSGSAQSPVSIDTERLYVHWAPKIGEACFWPRPSDPFPKLYSRALLKRLLPVYPLAVLGAQQEKPR